MKHRHIGKWTAAMLVVANAVSCPKAMAQSSRVPVAFVDRPLALPTSVMRLDGGPRWPDYDAQLKHIVIEDGADVDFLNPGFAFGVAQDLEFGFVFPLQIAPDSRLEDPRFYLLYALQESDFSYGIFGQVRAGFQDQTALLGGVPLYYRASSSFRLEAGGFAEVPFGDDPVLNLVFPVYFTFQPSERLYLGPETGLGLYGVFSDGSGIATPVGGFIGYTLGSLARPLGDLYGRLRYTDIPDGALEVMFGFEFFFDL